MYAYYKSSTAIVSVDGIRSKEFSTTQGVKQGGVLSPFLFNFFLDFIDSGNSQPKHWSAYRKIERCNTRELR